jgi:hypothetical protein
VSLWFAQAVLICDNRRRRRRRSIPLHSLLMRVFRSDLPLLLIALLAFALRIWDLNGVPLRWDEGWSIAHAALNPADILRITAQDVHPPLYYLLLHLWQTGAGLSPFAVRHFSVLASAAAVPLCYVTAMAWTGNRRLALYAAGLLAWLPLAVYYGAVARMYALAPSIILLAMWGALRLNQPSASLKLLPQPRRPARGPLLALALGCASAMYTFYHALWALAALALWCALQLLARLASGQLRERALTPAQQQALGAAIAMGLYLPWLLYGVPRLFGRAAAEAATNANQQLAIDYFLGLAIRDLLMTQRTGDMGLWLTLGLVVLGIAFAIRKKRGQWFRLTALPLSMIALTALGVAFAARQWAFNARMLVGAAPALALLLAWALAQLADDLPRWRSQAPRVAAINSLPLAALALLIGLYLPTSTRFVYEKSLEVFDPYSTSTYRDTIAPTAHPGDAVIFNVLSPAGFYASQRTATDPTWSYALTWDPVKEPRADWEARIRALTRQHDRLWLVLYRGLAQNSNNGDLRGWMDSHFYPAQSRWGAEEVFYGLYGVGGEMQPGLTAAWGEIALARAEAGVAVRPGGILPVALTWRVSAPAKKNYKVFVHVLKPDGFAIGQHDAAPLNDLRPFTTLPTGEDVADRHGVVIPPDAVGDVIVMVGLYDPDTGARLRTDDGREAVEITRARVAR